MKKLFTWCRDNVFFLLTLFLIAFIPLYPKLPLIDVRNVWVYIRAEDFIVLFALVYWGVVAVRKKGALQTPLTMPILLFWLIGAAATLHGLLLILPGLADVYANVAFFSFLRRIEYMSLFFIAYSSMKNKQLLYPLVVVLTATLFVVVVYGVGQKYVGFPAFLTMNEEFAKGIAIRLSPLSRVSSTFAGHYDLAAYLVLVIPIIVSLIFGFRNWFIRAVLFGTACLGLFVLFMTVSRISFFALFVSLGLVFVFQRKKLIILFLPIIAVVAILFLSFAPTLMSRFGSTIKEIDVLVDARTGDPIGHVKEVPKLYFEHKVVIQQFSRSITSLDAPASPSAILRIEYTNLPENVVLLTQPSAPTGEDLPQGTGYINLSLSPITKRIGEFFYEPKPNPKPVGVETADVFVINGQYLVKRALTYDLSFTTRFQGEWPRALVAFGRNVFLGSGYGSVSLAVDNSYLRMLAESGVLGLASFFVIFISIGIYLKKALPNIDSRPAKSFMFGLIAGIAGLGINALFIDVFEASKVAFVLWLLVGACLGIVRLYSNVTLEFHKELKNALTSSYAVALYLLIATIVLFSPMTRNYFVGDDFTWFRWVADCGSSIVSPQRCEPSVSTILGYFTQAQGFFYRPGTKLYFLVMYQLFWLNQTAYHVVSLTLHFVVSFLVYLLAKKIFRNRLLSTLSAFLFLVLSGYSEAIFWISATGFLFTTLFTMASLLMYISWKEKGKNFYFMGALAFFILSLLFHESGIVTPLLFLLYSWLADESISWRSIWSSIHDRILLLPIPLYLVARFFAHSHWFSGDYSYNIVKLPFNLVGNAIGYFFLALVGPLSVPFYQEMRTVLRGHTVVALSTVVAVLGLTVFLWGRVTKSLKQSDRKILLFGILFSVIALLPFLGLGNISARYSYLASVGMAFLFVFFMQKLYIHLLGNGRYIAIATVAVLTSVFCLLQITQLRQIHNDWYEAGVKSKRFILAIDGVYLNEWATEPVELHFVNVPIRFGEAWIFPVGIPDALWVVFRNPNLKVYSWPTLEQALGAVAYESKTQKVFVFDQEGNISEVKKTQSVQ